MKKLFLAMGLVLSSIALFSFTAGEAPAPDTFIIDEDCNVFYYADGSNCLIFLSSGSSLGDC